MSFDPSSRARLTRVDLPRFPDDTLFHKAARVACEVGILPRKELYEAWEVARRARRVFRGGRVVDLACGHGLLAVLMLLLDATSEGALAVDKKLTKSAPLLLDAFVAAWPRLAGRIEQVEGPLESVQIARNDIVVSVHACGALSDAVLARAIAAQASIALLPCCHDAAASDVGGLGGWLDDALAIDATRVATLRHAGYAVRTQTIPAAITPKNRLILANRPSPP